MLKSVLGSPSLLVLMVSVARKATLNTDMTEVRSCVNPFTAPGCKNSWAERCTNVPASANSVFSGPLAHLLSMLCVLMKVLLACQCENEDEKA